MTIELPEMTMMRVLPAFVCFIAMAGNYMSTSAAYVNVAGCPSLYLYIPQVKDNQTLPPCFCDNATAADDPPVQVNCFTQSTFNDLNQAITSVQKSGKKLAMVNIEYMIFDDNVGIPDHYFQKLGLTPSEITIVGCQNERLQLNYTFTGLEKSLKKLTVSGCNLLYVPPSIANLGALESLSLQDTYIYNIYKDDLRGLKKLKHLDLVGNQIVYVEEGAFDDLYNVEEAILGPRNSMNESALGELNKLKSAKKLILYNNYLHEFPDNALNALSNLQELDLSTNYIENITTHSFAGLNNLTKLTLSQNILKLVDDGSFRNLNNLRELDLGANFIEDIWPETFEGLGSLEQLNLDWNNFYVIYKDTFSAMPNLKTLTIRKNTNLQYIDPSAFNGLQNLRVLNFSLSNVSTIPVDLLRPIGFTLQTLDLSGSTLYDIGANSFQYGALLQNLSLADTQISTVPNGAFSFLTHLKYLDLTNIKWICDDKLAWMIRWLKEKRSNENLKLINPQRATCWEPLELRNQQLMSLDPAALKPYVPPTEIEQPPTTSTTVWPTETTSRAANGTNNSTDPVSSTASSTSTVVTKAPVLGDLTAVRNAASNVDSAKIKIVIAVVASVVAVATIAVIAIVVVITRKRKRKQKQQQQQHTQRRAVRDSTYAAAPPPPRPRMSDETEMAMT